MMLLGIGLCVAALVDIGLGVAVLFGRNWARLLLMGFCVATTVAAFAGEVRGRESITLATNLPTVGASILVLLALSSHRARDYATRGRQVPKRIAGRVGEHADF